MHQLDIIIDDQKFSEAVDGGLPEGGDLRFYVKAAGTVEGRPAVAITFSVQLPDGTIARAQSVTTARMLVVLGRMLAMKFPALADVQPAPPTHSPTPPAESRDTRRYATSDGAPPDPALAGLDSPAPQPIDPATGQHGAYWVLSEEERAKGFVRPLRDSYQHVGVRPAYPLRDLAPDESVGDERDPWVKYEAYPDPKAGQGLGRYWTQRELSSGCGCVTRMGRAIAETYAREPRFYGSTFCANCGEHFLLEEFRWLDAQGNLTDEVVGS